jgi:hypothetical protein
MVEQPARTRRQRKADLLTRLEKDMDAWFATSSVDGEPYLVPLSFLWADESILVSTIHSNPTAVNFRETGRVRVALGLARDVYLIDASVGEVAEESISEETGDAFASKCKFDPRKLQSYHFYRVVPKTVQSWRELNELADRDIMTDGNWLT